MRCLFFCLAFLFTCSLVSLVGCAGNMALPATSLPGASAAGSPQSNNGSLPGTSTTPSNPESSTFIFVANAGTGTDLQVFRLNKDGSLVSVPEPNFTSGSQILGIAGGYLVAGSGGHMATFQVDSSSGAVSQVSSFVAGGASVAGNISFVYAGGTNAIYGYALSNGQLTPLTGFPYAVEANACNCAVPIYRNLAVRQGYLFYAVNADHAGSWIEVKKIGADGALSDVPSAACANGAVNASSTISVSPDGRFIYEGSGGFPSLELTSFDPNSSTLSCSQYTGSQDVFDSGVIDPAGHFLIAHQAVAAASPEIGTYRIDSSTGQLTSASSLSSAGQPEAIDPSGRYLLTIESPTPTSFAIGVYAIDSNDGSLSQIGSYPLGADSAAYFPVNLVVANF
jgi:6-phosphogluconolactonase (cycloisomerase 2 family)